MTASLKKSLSIKFTFQIFDRKTHKKNRTINV